MPTSWRSKTSEMLRDLKEAHRQLRSCMEEMEALTGGPIVDRLSYTAARYRISKASIARRACSNEIRVALSIDANARDLEALATIARVDRELMSHSAAHVHEWTAQTIEENWAGYCQASRQVRWHMAKQLEVENSLLFPILKRQCASSPSERTRGLLREQTCAHLAKQIAGHGAVQARRAASVQAPELGEG